MILSGTASIPFGAVTASLPVPFLADRYTAKVTPATPLGWFPVISILSKAGSLDVAFSVPAPDNASVDWIVNR